jgi:biotin carboxylase
MAAVLRRRGSGRVHPFIASPGQFDLAAALERRSGVPVRVAGGNPHLVAYADFKHHIRAKAVELGVPVAPGEVVDLGRAGGVRQREYAMLVSAMERQVEATGRVIVRGTSGAAGSATFSAGPDTESLAALATEVAARRENRIYLIESMVEMTSSPNVQMEIPGERGPIECVGVTDQRWERSLVHGGNLFPSTASGIAQMVSWARTLGEWLQSEGFAGLAGFDFVEYTDRSGMPGAFLAEINPRVNGATYPLRLTRRLNAAQRAASRPEIAAFVSGTIETDAGSFAELRDSLDGLLFSPERGEGLVPYVTGCLPHGKCSMVALAASPTEAFELFDEAGASGLEADTVPALSNG